LRSSLRRLKRFGGLDFVVLPVVDSCRNSSTIRLGEYHDASGDETLPETRKAIRAIPGAANTGRAPGLPSPTGRRLTITRRSRDRISLVERPNPPKQTIDMNQTRLFALLLLALAGMPALRIDAQQRAETQRPNIVWIFVEDMNDWFGCYGDDTVPTPHIDALAERGVRFDRAYMPAGVCSATRSAIATGAMQTSLDIHNHRSSRQRVPAEVIHLPDGVKTVYQLMREAGYFVTTQGMNKNDFNFLFDGEELYDQQGGKMLPGLWRNRREGRPFFAQIQLRGGKHAFHLRGNRRTDPDAVSVAPYYADHPAIREQYAKHYDTIRITDREVGRIINALGEDDLLDDTIIFFWTDHGMQLHRHKQWLYEGGIRVPFIVAGPERFKRHRIVPGSVRSDLVSGIDITATTLALAGIGIASPLPWLEGRDLFDDDFAARDYVISARDRCDYTIDRVRAVTTRNFKYLRNYKTDRTLMQPQYRDGRPYIEAERVLFRQGRLTDAQAFKWQARMPEELYGLESDPHETRNLANDPAYSEVVAEHRAILEKWIQETDDRGQYPESIDSLRGVLKRWNKQAVNPEFEKAREVIENEEES
jgi:arylsulfatase A-like enzyme